MPTAAPQPKPMSITLLHPHSAMDAPYQVQSITNSLLYDIGDFLTEADIQPLIDDPDWTVIIIPGAAI